MKKNMFFLVIVVTCVVSAPAAKPNVIFILADDLGYMDIAAYAAKVRGVDRAECYYETPHIDTLVDQGVAFSQAYANQLCSPSRAAILTGRYHCRIGMTTAWFDNIPNYYNQGQKTPEGYHPLDSNHGDNIQAEQAWNNAKVIHGLPSGSRLDQGWDEICIPEVLDEHRAAFIGKWHLGGGGVQGYTPADQGFHVLAHLDIGACQYFNWQRLWKPNTWTVWKSHKAIWDQPRFHGSWQSEIQPDEKYLTDRLTDLAVDYIRDAAKKPETPFLLYFSHFSVHTPIQARPQDIAYFTEKSTRGWNGQDNPTYAGMVKALDDSVGRIIETLKETDQTDNTIIVFFSDNGGLMPFTSNAPLRNGKAFLHEGGIRVPLIVYAPAVIKKPAWSDVPVHAVDILPTLAELSGKKVKHTIDGRSFATLLNDPANARGRYPVRPMYWHYPFNVGLDDPQTGLPLTPSSAIRQGDYKLIWDWHGRLSLFNLKEDLEEKHNLTEEKPELTSALFETLVSWLDQNVERRYFPTRNPDYNAEKDKRDYPFSDLRKELLGLTHEPGLDDRMGKNAGRP